MIDVIYLDCQAWDHRSFLHRTRPVVRKIPTDREDRDRISRDPRRRTYSIRARCRSTGFGGTNIKDIRTESRFSTRWNVHVEFREESTKDAYLFSLIYELDVGEIFAADGCRETERIKLERKRSVLDGLLRSQFTREIHPVLVSIDRSSLSESALVRVDRY